MRLRITIAMLEIRNRKTLQSKVNICKSDVKIGDYADSLETAQLDRSFNIQQRALHSFCCLFQTLCVSISHDAHFFSKCLMY